MQFGRVQLTPNLHGIESAFETETAGLLNVSFVDSKSGGASTVYTDNLGLRNWGRIYSFLLPFV